MSGPVNDHERPFPTADDQRDPFADEIGARLRGSYATVARLSADDLAQVTRTILAATRRAQPVPPATPARGGVRSRWWWGAAAAALLVVMLMRPWRPDLSQHYADSAFTNARALGLPSGITSEERGGTVRFEFTVPSHARRVALVGDFNGWDERATPMVQRGDDGAWSARVPLPPGRHQYAFVVDGTRWLVDPLAPQVPDGGYGPTNAVIVEGEAPR